MKSKYRISTKMIAMFLSMLFVFYNLPISAIAQEISNSNTSTAIPSNTSEGQDSTNNNSTTQKPYTYYNEVYEETSLREESVKHFRLEDGSFVAAQYASPVHYLNEEGEWQNIDNTLTESGSEFVTSDARVKFIKKTTGNGNIFTLHDGNTKITLSLAGANKKASGIVTNTEESETTEIGKLMSLEGLSSRIRYNEILDGVDIEYVLDSLSIKENIIIKEQKDIYAYTFTLSLNGLEAELLTSGDISITKNGEQKYTIPAPVVFDSADSTAPTDAASYALIDNGNGKYTLTVSVSPEWMNSPDRAYPVTLDPAIIKENWGILDTYGTPGMSSDGFSSATLNVSDDIALIKIRTLPTLPVGAKISAATLKMFRTSGTGGYIGAYLVNEGWDTAPLNVATLTYGVISDYAYTKANEDGTYGIDGEGTFIWDITKIVESWYNGTENNGIALKRMSGSGTTVFASVQNSDASLRPSFSISYVNTLGLEDYYSYSTQSGGAAGTGYVNYATGDLTFAIGTLTSTDCLMPVTPTLVYNSALANSKYTSSTVNTANATSCMPNGFKLNLYETVVKRTTSSTNGTLTYYIWADGDGTEHFFYQSADDPNVYLDDSGLLLNLVVETDTYDGYSYPYTTVKITDVDQNVRIFERFVDDANYSQGPWYLTAIDDKVGNRMILSYEDYGIEELVLYPKNSGSIRTFTLTYNSGVLRYILNNDNSICVALRYSDTYNGELSATASNYLRQVVYAHDTNAAHSSWLTYYNSGSASGIVTDATMYYEYDADGYLISAKNGLADYTVNYEWTNGKVTSVYEKGGTTQGVKLGFTYGTGYTEVTTPGGDGNYSTTADNIINRYSYDSFYRVVSTYSTSYDRGTIYGASSGIYSHSSNAVNSDSSSSDDVAPPNNRLIETNTIGGSHTNYLLNGNFSLESDAGEILYWNRSHNTIVPDTILDAIKIPSASGTYYISQVVYLSPGDYTYREYDGTNLKRIANDDGEIWDYTYNEMGMIADEIYYSFSYNGQVGFYPYLATNPDSIIEKTPITKTDYKYNAYGQITSVETYPAEMGENGVVKKPGSPSVVTENTYITTSGSPIFGALQTTSDGTGRTLKYFYDTKRGYLLAEVNVGAGTGTAYTYDAIGNLISARPATCDSEGTSYSTVTGAESVTYSYNTKNELSKITTASSTYTFTYDSFGNLSRFVEGDIRYYYDNTGKLRGAYYSDSNGLSFEYEYNYDKLGRLVSEYGWYEEEIDSYEDEDGNVYIEYEYTDILLKEYEYTADGKLYRVYDALNEEYVQYNYDVKGRLETVLRYGSDRINDFVTEYDYDSLSGTEEHLRAQEYGFSYLAGTSAVDIRIRNSYFYDARNRLSEEKLERDGVTTRIEYSYDDFGRLSEKETTSGSLTQQETYGYKTVNGATTGEVVTYTSKVGDVTTTYTYTYDARGNIVSISKDGLLLFDYVYDDLGQLVYEENFDTGEFYNNYYDNAGNLIYREEGMYGAEYFYEYAPSPFGDRLVSFNGETISYDSSGRTVVYRGKQITYLQADANKIESIGNVSFTYDADGMRRSKTVGGVTHYYTYDGIQLVKEEWGNNVMIFLYDALGAPVGMQYRNSTYAADVWDIYYYEKNLQGDIVAVYNTSGTKLVSYDYDAWGYISCVTYSNGGASTSVVHNPLRYRGYYYDDDLDLYYLATRYYDPEVCRFVTADSYVSTGQGILGNNRYAYCGNNPVMYVDPHGTYIRALAVPVLAALICVAIYPYILDALTTVAEGITTGIQTLVNSFEEEQVEELVAEKEEVIPATPPSGTVIYRYYASKDENLSPRVGKDYDGLSFSTLPPRPGVSAVVTTIEEVNATGILIAIPTGGSHITIIPTNGTAKQWMSEGQSSIWSQTLSLIVVELNGGR